MSRAGWRLAAILGGVLVAAATVRAPAAFPKFKPPKPNMPDQRVCVVGPFLWARAVGPHEDVSFGTKPGDLVFTFTDGAGLKRSNLTSRDPNVGYTAQLQSLRLDTTGAHNCKLMLGTMKSDWRFTHGDNNDLVHWAARDRVVLFVPIRHPQGADPSDPEAYLISPYGGQTISVVEFKAGELIHYEWYRAGPDKLDPHILMDLYPHCGGEKDPRPGVMQPIFKFETFPGGRWRASIEPDGRDGLAGGTDPAGFDLVFTETSPGARPYTVDLRGQTACGVSVYCPSGSPNLGAEIRLHLQPYDRASGKAVSRPWPRVKVADVVLGGLDRVLADLEEAKAGACPGGVCPLPPSGGAAEAAPGATRCVEGEPPVD